MRQNNPKKDEVFYNFLKEISNNYRTISFIGLDKASGKTTTLKVFLQALKYKRVGVTSIGTDHQTKNYPVDDHCLIYVSEGTVVATSRNSLNFCDTTKEILHTTGIQSPSGEIIVFKAKSDGYVFLAGPSMIADSMRIRDLLLASGAEVVLIDGALDRKSSAFPGHSDAIVVTASLFWQGEGLPQEKLSREMEILTTPVLEDAILGEICLENLNVKAPFFLIDETRRIFIPQESNINHELFTTIANFDKPIKVIFVRGAITNSLVSALLKADKKITAKLANVRIVAEDPTKLIVSAGSLQSLVNQNIHIRVLKPIKILALSLNPFHLGWDTDRVIKVLKEHAFRFHLPVIDSVGGLFVEGI